MKFLIVLSAIFGVLSAVPYGSKLGGGGIIGGGSGSAANAAAQTSSLSSGKKFISLKF